MSAADLADVLLAVAVLVVPGTAGLLLCRIRPTLIWGAAPAVTVVLAVLAGAVLHLLAVPWTPVTAAVSLAVMLLIGAAGREALRRRRAPEEPWTTEEAVLAPRRTHPAAHLAAMLAGGAMIWSAARRMGGLDTLNGSFDAYFHIAAIGFIRRDRDAFLLTALTGIYGEPTAYPASVDILAALLPGTTVQAGNAMMLAMLALLPAAAGVLAGEVLRGRTTERGRAAGQIAAILVIPLCLSVPAMALVMGLWPHVLGALCLAPALAALWMLGVSALAVRRRRARRAAHARSDRETGVVAPLLVLAGAVLAHPANAFSLALAVACSALAVVLLWVIVPHTRRRGTVLLLVLGAVCAVYGVFSIAALSDMAMTSPSPWAWFYTAASILLERPRIAAIPGDLWPLIVPWLLAGLGLLGSIRRRELCGLAAAVLIAVVFALSMATQSTSPLLTVWTNPWYGARERIAPLLVAGLTVLVALAAARGATASERSGRMLALGLGAALVVTSVAGVVVPQRLGLLGSLAYTNYGVQLAPYVTAEERAFIEREAARLPEDAVVISNPRDGGAAFWSLGGVETVFPTLADPQTLDSRRVARYAHEAAEDPKVCGSWKAVGATHLYVDDSLHSGRTIAPIPSEQWQGLLLLKPSQLDLIASDGPYKLYRIAELC